MYIRYEIDSGKVINVSSDASYAAQINTETYGFAAPANSPDGFDLAVSKIYDPATDTIRNATQSELSDWELREAKTAKLAEIDAKTEQLISHGFTFDGHQFSLSIEAQSNWHVLWNGRESIVAYPKEVSTKDSEAYLIVDSATMNVFGLTALNAVSNHIQAGRDIKVQVKAATTTTEVNAITDNR